MLLLYVLGAQKDIKESGNSGCSWGVDLMARAQKRELSFYFSLVLSRAVQSNKAASRHRWHLSMYM